MKIVLTGGPSAGKTTILDILYRSDSDQIAVVQEAASILYRGGFPRSVDACAVQSQQSAIYFVQRALEDIVAYQSPGKMLLCDRGSLDGLAYWLGTQKSFFAKIHSSMSREVHRYDWVLHLDSAAPQNYKRSSIRSEKSSEAAKINDLVKFAWREHPRRLIVPNSNDFQDKVAVVLRCLALIQEKKSVDEIHAILGI